VSKNSDGRVEYKRIFSYEYHANLIGKGRLTQLFFSMPNSKFWRIKSIDGVDLEASGVAVRNELDGFISWQIDVSKLCTNADICAPLLNESYNIKISIEHSYGALYWKLIILSALVLFCTLCFLTLSRLSNRHH
jgi:hypothetical protein